MSGLVRVGQNTEICCHTAGKAPTKPTPSLTPSLTPLEPDDNPAQKYSLPSPSQDSAEPRCGIPDGATDNDSSPFCAAQRSKRGTRSAATQGVHTTASQQTPPTTTVPSPSVQPVGAVREPPLILPAGNTVFPAEAGTQRIAKHAVKSPSLEPSPSPSQGEIKRGSQGEGEPIIPAQAGTQRKAKHAVKSPSPSMGEGWGEGEPFAVKSPSPSTGEG